jgi:GTP-binding protein HflX
VRAVLGEVGAADVPDLLVLNKADLLEDEERGEVLLRHPDALLVSAETGEGIEALRDRIERAFEETLAPVELLIPYSEGSRLHELHELAGDLERTDRSDGVLVKARVPASELHRFNDLSTNGLEG